MFKEISSRELVKFSFFDYDFVQSGVQHRSSVYFVHLRYHVSFKN